MAENTYQVVVIGSGPGGYVAAVRAAQLGFKTACVERWPSLGGTCLNVGCIPSKCLLQTTEDLAWVHHSAKDHGINIESVSLDFDKMMSRKSEVVKGLTQSVANLFKTHKIDSITGIARFKDPHSLIVENMGETKEVTADQFIIATGSEPIPLPFLPFDKSKVLTSTDILSLKAAPKKLAVVGAGSIGIEMASVYQRLGTEVAIIEMFDRALPNMDATLGRTLQRVMAKQNIAFHLSAKVENAKVDADHVELTVKTSDALQSISADCVLVSIGRRPYTKGLNLGEIGIKTDQKGFIVVDKAFRTEIPHILAIGDVIEGPMLAHKAMQEGVAAAEILAGQAPKVDYMSIPNVVYSHPEVASVGFMESEAKELNFTPLIGTSYFRGNARARCMGDLEGLVKIVGDSMTGKLLGLHIIGPHASEMIGEGVMALQQRAAVQEIAYASHAHPTLSEAIKEAALQALGHPIH